MGRRFLWEFREDGGTQKHSWGEGMVRWKQSWEVENQEPLNRISRSSKRKRGLDVAEACIAFPSSCNSSRSFLRFSCLSCFFLSFATCLSSCSEEEDDSLSSLFCDSIFYSILQRYSNAPYPSFHAYLASCSTLEPSIPSFRHQSIINPTNRIHTILAIFAVSQPNSSKSAW